MSQNLVLFTSDSELKLKLSTVELLTPNSTVFSDYFDSKFCEKVCDMTAINKTQNFLTAINMNPEISDIAPGLPHGPPPMV